MIKLLKNFKMERSADTCRSAENSNDDNTYIVYKLANDGAGYEIYEPYDESKAAADGYGDGDYVAIPLRTTGCSVEKFNRNQIIENVEGSKDDQRPSGHRNWLALLASQGCPTDECCTDGKFYAIGSDDNIIAEHDDTHACSTYIGGHVFKGMRENQKIGADSDVYLLSICKYHNSKNHGLGYYMRVGKDCNGMKLIGYLRKSVVQNAILAKTEAAAAKD